MPVDGIINNADSSSKAFSIKFRLKVYRKTINPQKNSYSWGNSGKNFVKEK